uniref:Uncharacterized protein n=1 Tax=Avena sativa TaxID=4498 RepID=A0ACD5VA90_AVESA
MGTKRSTAAILLVLSLEALVAGRLSAATGEAATAARPWKCCDQSWCTKSFPPTCHCEDKVSKCDKNCQRCEKADDRSNGGSPRYVCRDTYGKAGPPCPGSAVGGEGEQARPWKCCDLPRCTRSSPPTCTCMDKVNKCAKNCERCEKADGGSSSRYMCKDSYFGSPGPMCSKQSVAAGGSVLVLLHLGASVDE